MLKRFKVIATGLLITTLLSLPFSALAVNRSVQVAVDTLNVRSGPGLTETILATVSSKTVLPVLAEKDNWLQVRLPTGQTGWLANWLVTPVAAAAQAKQVTTQNTGVNIRSGPSTTFPSIGSIQPGAIYPLLKKSGEWVQIQLPNQQTGWVAGWLVTETSGSTPNSSSGTANSTPNQTGTPSAPPAGGSATSHPTPPAQTGGSSVPIGKTIKLATAQNAYMSPDANQQPIGQLSAGDVIPYNGEANGWLQISYNGTLAWIQANPNNQIVQAPKPTPPANGTSPVTPQPDAGGGPSSATLGTITVTSPSINLRSQPSTESDIISGLTVGTSLAVLSSQNDWYQVRTPNGQVGWVANWLVSRPDQTVAKKATITVLNPDTNVRTGPDTKYDIVGRVQAGETYEIVTQSGDWFQIKLANGQTGYIAGWLVSADGTSNVVKGNELVNKVIVVDPGHGGNDNGATGSSYATLEKNINLDVALLLRNKLEAAGAKVIMTRSDDRTLTLQGRVDVAVQNNADVFVSIHHNTHPNTATNGTIVFYYNEGNSSKLASLVETEVVAATKYNNMQSRFGNYYVLRENPVVSILAEIGFISNPNEELMVRSPKQQDLAAEGIYKGLLRYFANQ